MNVGLNLKSIPEYVREELAEATLESVRAFKAKAEGYKHFEKKKAVIKFEK